MKRHGASVIATIVFLIVSSVTVLADEVHLRNGDRISGKIIHMEENKLVVMTDYAGEITISWDQVESLDTGEKITVVLDDGTSIEGQTVTMEAGRMKLKSDILEEPSIFSLEDVKTINPKIEPPVKFTGRFNTGITLERGNNDTEDIEFDASFQARTKKSRYTVGGEFNREKTDDELTAEDWTAFANYDYFISQKWFGYVRTMFEHDEFADLDLQSTLGGGLGYQVFEGETLNLSFQAGPAYVDENHIEAVDDSFTVAQWVINYDQYFMSRLFQLFHLSDGYMSFENAGDWIINTRHGIRFPLYKGITATLQYSYDYDNEPSPDARADYDSKLSFLLGYEYRN
jgi:putative salt-induced outer membrane protein YdiY